MISYGPIPSRRLGKSLGINNIPSGQKVCSYSCIYCQVGVTKIHTLIRYVFYDPETIYREVKNHLLSLKEEDKPDYLTFVSSGEPTLDFNIGKTIEWLKTLNIPIAVITNASLLSDPLLRADLKSADWVSVKIDSGDEAAWKAINRPVAKLDFEKYKQGLLLFAKEYKGKLVSETMIVKGVNDSTEIMRQTAELVSLVNPATAYLAIPTRPPAVSTVTAPDENTINEAYQFFAAKNINTELILGFEGTDTGFTGNAGEDILNISAVHPIREDTMLELLKKNHADMSLVQSMLQDQLIQKLEYDSKTFYLRKFKI